MTQAICLATYPLNALDPRAEVVCALAIRQLELDYYYSPEDLALFLCAPPASEQDLNELQSSHEKNLRNHRFTYGLQALKAFTHPALTALSQAGLRGETRFWSEKVDLNLKARDSFSENENAIIFALDFFHQELKIYEYVQSHTERLQKKFDDDWLKNQVL